MTRYTVDLLDSVHGVQLALRYVMSWSSLLQPRPDAVPGAGQTAARPRPCSEAPSAEVRIPTDSVKTPTRAWVGWVEDVKPRDGVGCIKIICSYYFVYSSI